MRVGRVYLSMHFNPSLLLAGEGLRRATIRSSSSRRTSVPAAKEQQRLSLGPRREIDHLADENGVIARLECLDQQAVEIGADVPEDRGTPNLSRDDRCRRTVSA